MASSRGQQQQRSSLSCSSKFERLDSPMDTYHRLLAAGYSHKSASQALPKYRKPMGRAAMRKNRTMKGAIRADDYTPSSYADGPQYSCPDPSCGSALVSVTETSSYGDFGNFQNQAYRCTGCNQRVTKGAAKKRLLELTPIAQLIIEDRLAEVGLPRLKACLKEHGKSVGGGKVHPNPTLWQHRHL